MGLVRSELIVLVRFRVIRLKSRGLWLALTLFLGIQRPRGAAYTRSEHSDSENVRPVNTFVVLLAVVTMMSPILVLLANSRVRCVPLCN